MWVGLGLLKESEACLPNVTSAKRGRLLSQVKTYQKLMTMFALYSVEYSMVYSMMYRMVYSMVYSMRRMAHNSKFK